jgi:cyclic pyranopterin phosphate synthase
MKRQPRRHGAESQRADKTVLTHLNSRGESRMVDVSPKAVTVREAVASGVVRMKADAMNLLIGGRLPKGDAIHTARLAGIQAAKRTADWIPMCHVLPLDFVGIEFARRRPRQLEIRCTVRATARTGVEMEALTGVAAAALTLYDMAKSADKGMVIGPIRLERKTGGQGGDYNRTGHRKSRKNA